MKKYLSILFTAIFAAMFVFSTTSCSKDDSATDANIVGTWKRVDGIYEDEIQYRQYKKNGTWIQVDVGGAYSYIHSGTWRLSGNILTLTLESEKEPPVSFKIKELTKESMTYTVFDEFDEFDEFDKLIEAKFKRVPDSEIKKYL